ncbi:unnamed protein product, partial [Pocillopora meandrina]
MQSDFSTAPCSTTISISSHYACIPATLSCHCVCIPATLRSCSSSTSSHFACIPATLSSRNSIDGYHCTWKPATFRSCSSTTLRSHNSRDGRHYACIPATLRSYSSSASSHYACIPATLRSCSSTASSHYACIPATLHYRLLVTLFLELQVLYIHDWRKVWSNACTFIALYFGKCLLHENLPTPCGNSLSMEWKSALYMAMKRGNEIRDELFEGEGVDVAVEDAVNMAGALCFVNSVGQGYDMFGHDCEDQLATVFEMLCTTQQSRCYAVVSSGRTMLLIVNED